MRPSVSVVLFCLLYLLGLGATLYGNDFEPIEKGAILLLGLLVSLGIYYPGVYVPLIRLQTKHRSALMGYVFEDLEKTYKEIQPGHYELRMNVMRVKRRPHVIGTRCMKIDYHKGDYTGAELEQLYNIDIGCCGTAVKEKTQIYFDAREAQEPHKGMTDTQRAVTNRINSILSTPIFRPTDQSRNMPVAVLNLDSESFIIVTKFNENTSQELTDSYAEIIGALL